MIRFHGSTILLDLEGTVSTLRYREDVLVPYAAREVNGFLRRHGMAAVVREACALLVQELGGISFDPTSAAESDAMREAIVSEVQRLSRLGESSSGLKALQQVIWLDAFERGELCLHVYPDVLPAIGYWAQLELDLRMFSTTNSLLQQACLAHTQLGNLLSFFHGNHDTAIGSIDDPASYARLARDVGVAPERILRLSHDVKALEAARAAGLMAVLVLRPGHATIDRACPFPFISSFAQIQPR